MVIASTCQDNAFGPVVQGCRSDFDFTLLFEQSVLTIGPAALLLLFAPSRLISLLSSSRKTFSRRILSIKAVCIFSLIPSAVLSFLVSIMLLFLSGLEDGRAVRPSLLVNAYLLISLIFDVAQVRTLYLRQDDQTILGLFTANIGIKVVLLLLESRSKLRYLRVPYNTYSPEATSGVFSTGFFWWLTSLLTLSFQRLMTLDDLFQPDQELLSEPLLGKMQTSWNKCGLFLPSLVCSNLFRSFFGKECTTRSYF